MADVFLSYSRRDIEFMRRVRKHLEDAGIVVWTDEKLDPGTPAWTKSIEREIRLSRLLVVILSPDSAESIWVERELAMADTCGVAIIPLLLRGEDRTAIPFRLISHQLIDARADATTALLRLTTTLKTRLGGGSTPAPIKEQPAPGGDFVRVVAKTGPADFRTIGDAIAKAPDGAIIRVRPGLYRESLSLKRTVELVGDGDASEIVVENTTGKVLLMQADYAALRNLTFRLRASGNVKDYCIEVTKGRLMLEDCDITSSSLACMGVHNAESEVIVRRCRIHDGNESGIYFYDNATGIVEDCSIHGNALAGVAITRGANPLVRNCRMYDGKQNAIFVYDNGLGTIENCDIYNHTLSGIEIKSGANPTVRGCVIRDGKSGGIYVQSGGRGVIEDCDIYNNTLSGIEVKADSNPLIRNCEVHDGKAGGIYVQDKGLGTIEACKIYGNMLAGIEIKGGSNPTVRNCHIYNGKSGGLYVQDKGLGNVQNCDIYGNALSCVEIKSEANPSIRNCRVYDGTTVGLLAHEKGLGVVEDCEIWGNGYSGIEIRNSGNPTVRRCKVNRNAYQAVYAHDNALGTVENSDLTGNKHGAWSIDATSRVTQNNNKV